ncbi:MAG: hypothetical protein R6U78_14630 [Bacteroidales bacterium]
MRKLLFKNSILLIIYILVSVYFAIFNWQIFTVNLNVDLGFGVVTFPPFIMLFLLGFVIIGILSWMNYNSGLRRMIYELESGLEMGKMKERLTGGRVRELLTDDKNLELLKSRLGITEIRKKQEEITTILSDLKKAGQEQK